MPYGAWLLAAALVTLGAPLRSEAQEPGAPASPALRLRPGKTLRIQTVDSTIAGRFIAWQGDSLMLQTPTGPRGVAGRSVTGIWQRSSGSSAVLAGAAFGIGMLALIRLGAGGYGENSGIASKLGFGILAGSVLLGAMIGSLSPEWIRQYP
jgi:hypothetical protein